MKIQDPRVADSRECLRDVGRVMQQRRLVDPRRSNSCLSEHSATLRDQVLLLPAAPMTDFTDRSKHFDRGGSRRFRGGSQRTLTRGLRDERITRPTVRLLRADSTSIAENTV